MNKADEKLMESLRQKMYNEAGIPKDLLEGGSTSAVTTKISIQAFEEKIKNKSGI